MLYCRLNSDFLLVINQCDTLINICGREGSETTQSLQAQIEDGHQSKPDMWTKVQGWKRDRPIVRGGQGMNAPWECLSCPPAPKRQGTVEDIRDVQVKKKGNIWGRQSSPPHSMHCINLAGRINKEKTPKQQFHSSQHFLPPLTGS